MKNLLLMHYGQIDQTLKPLSYLVLICFCHRVYGLASNEATHNEKLSHINNYSLAQYL